MAKDSKLTKDEIEAILKMAQVDKDERTKSEKFLDSLEDAPIATIKKAILQKALFVAVKGGMADDSYEANQLSKKSYRMRNSLRGAGGFSY